MVRISPGGKVALLRRGAGAGVGPAAVPATNEPGGRGPLLPYLTLGSLAVVLAGGGLLGTRTLRGGGRVFLLTTTWLLGLTALVPIHLALGLAGVPVGAGSVAGAALLLALGATGLRFLLGLKPGSGAPGERPASEGQESGPSWVADSLPGGENRAGAKQGPGRERGSASEAPSGAGGLPGEADRATSRQNPGRGAGSSGVKEEAGGPGGALGTEAGRAPWELRVGDRAVRASEVATAPPSPARASRWARVAAALPRLVLLGAVAVFVWKVVAMPLWSWDHYAIWGAKARLLFPGGTLDVDRLSGEELSRSRPDYPLGLPLAVRVLTLGRMPEPADFKAVHLAFALALLVLLRRGLGTLTSSRPAADLLAAWVAASPLAWDTVMVGVAEVPLALWATAGAVLVLEARGDRMSAWVPGAAVGFLPWIKDEGLPLAALLGMAGAVLLARAPATAERHERRRRLASFLGAAGLLAGAALAFAAWKLPRGFGFFRDDPWATALSRLPEAPELLAAMGGLLAAPAFLGFWLVLPAAAVAALALRRETGVTLLAVVLAQLALYTAVTFFTYLSPLPHVAAAYARIASALVPLGTLAVAAVWGSLLTRPAKVPV